MRMQKVVPVALLGLVLVAVGAAPAFDYHIDPPTKVTTPVKGEEVTGTYSLDPLEHLVAVYIISYDADGNWSSMAEGTVDDPEAGDWSASLFDSQMASYQIWFHVHYGYNQVYDNYYTPKYAWGTGP
jgi:hypothetical protein